MDMDIFVAFLLVGSQEKTCFFQKRRQLPAWNAFEKTLQLSLALPGESVLDLIQPLRKTTMMKNYRNTGKLKSILAWNFLFVNKKLKSQRNRMAMLRVCLNVSWLADGRDSGRHPP